MKRPKSSLATPIITIPIGASSNAVSKRSRASRSSRAVFAFSRRLTTGDDFVEHEFRAKCGDRRSDYEAVEPERSPDGSQPFTNEEGDCCNRARIEGEPEDVADRREGRKRFVLHRVVIELTDRV